MIKVTEQTYKEALNRLANTDDGKIVLAGLANNCFFNRDAFVQGDKDATYTKAAIQRVYLTLRKYIDVDKLKKIEYDYELVALKMETKDASKER